MKQRQRPSHANFSKSFAVEYPLLQEYGLNELFSSLGPGELLKSLEDGINMFLSRNLSQVNQHEITCILLNDLLSWIDDHLNYLGKRIQTRVTAYLNDEEAYTCLLNSIYLVNPPHQFTISMFPAHPVLWKQFEYSHKTQDSMSHIEANIRKFEPEFLLTIGWPPIAGLVNELHRITGGESHSTFIDLFMQMKLIFYALTEVLHKVLKKKGIILGRINGPESHGMNTSYMKYKLKYANNLGTELDPDQIRLKEEIAFKCSYGIIGVKAKY